MGGEKGVFRSLADGSEKPDPFVRFDDLDDCTHYVSRCLKAEGVKLTETGRANELAEAMIKSHQTKTFAIKCSKAEGQNVIDSGMFKPGDLVAYFTHDKGRYTHTAMFVGWQRGEPDDPGGITCHTVCRFQGLSKTWNGAEDDDWFLHDSHSYTLIHFAEDDPLIATATKKWLPGWWKAGEEFYFVDEHGRAHSTRAKPLKRHQRLGASAAVGYYFEGDKEIVFVWRLPAGRVRIERWTPPSGAKGATRTVEGRSANLSRVF
jgi:hypothetical protein